MAFSSSSSSSLSSSLSSESPGERNYHIFYNLVVAVADDRPGALPDASGDGAVAAPAAGLKSGRFTSRGAAVHLAPGPATRAAAAGGEVALASLARHHYVAQSGCYAIGDSTAPDARDFDEVRAWRRSREDDARGITIIS